MVEYCVDCGVELNSLELPLFHPLATEREKTRLRRKRCAFCHDRAVNRNWAKWTRRGILMSLRHYFVLLAAQDYRCPITLELWRPGIRLFAVDHNHITGALRGLLVSRANSGLGLFNADVSTELLKAARDYLLYPIADRISGGPVRPVPEALRHKWHHHVQWRRRTLNNLTADLYYALYEVQNGRCAICLSPRFTPKYFAVDHDDTTHRVRGLLCRNCNLGLGCFHDSVVELDAAIRYIEGWCVTMTHATPSQESGPVTRCQDPTKGVCETIARKTPERIIAEMEETPKHALWWRSCRDCGATIDMLTRMTTEQGARVDFCAACGPAHCVDCGGRIEELPLMVRGNDSVPHAIHPLATAAEKQRRQQERTLCNFCFEEHESHKGEPERDRHRKNVNNTRELRAAIIAGGPQHPVNVTRLTHPNYAYDPSDSEREYITEAVAPDETDDPEPFGKLVIYEDIDESGFVYTLFYYLKSRGVLGAHVWQGVLSRSRWVVGAVPISRHRMLITKIQQQHARLLQIPYNVRKHLIRASGQRRRKYA